MQNYIFIILFLTSFTLVAQGINLKGIVLDEDGIPLPGATVINVETSDGIITNFDGKFSIEINSSHTLEVSYIGYKKVLISGPFEDELEIVLVSSNLLDEIVMTALGIKRQEKALGYSVQGINASQISKVKTTNFVNSLAGKVAGVNITGSSAGPSASVNINIRGASSLMGNNQPLFVVNGMPITNDLYSFDDGLNGSTSIDFGNASQIINTDDIEAISILKGPAASALYGSRAANGVILVETKTGDFHSEGLGVEVNTSIQFSSPLKLPNYQNEYGSGGGGKYSYLDGSTYIGPNENYDAYGENWGPRLNGQLVKQYNSNGQATPFSPSPNNVKDFYRTSINQTYNVAINSSSIKGQSRFSYTHLDNLGLVPNTDLERNTFQVSMGKSLLDDKLKVQFNSMFVRSTSDNIPNSGYDESSSIMYGWLWLPRQADINDLRNYWQPSQEGVQQRYAENLWVNNPWFIVNENTNAFQSNRLVSNLQLYFDISPMFNARFRYGSDYVDEQRQYRRAPSTKAVPNGSYREDEISFRESNTEFILNFDPTPETDDLIDINLRVGGNLMSQKVNFGVANNPELQIFGTGPSVYTLANSRSGVLVESQKTNAEILSAFGLLSLDFNNWAYLDITYRNDWTSTLVNPLVGMDNSNFSFGYPSVSTSVLLSEMLNLSEQINFLKVRASYAEVGNGAPAYSFGNTYTPKAPFGNTPVFTAGNTISDPNLKNEKTTSKEFGLDLRLLSNKVNIDFTVYQMNSFDQIISLPVAKSSGYDFTLTNGGEISNKGIEISAEFNWMEKEDFSWTSQLNFGQNRAIVESLPDVIESGRYSIVADVFPGDEGGSDLELVAEEGELLGQLYGLGFQRSPDGQIIHENGLPLHTTEKVSAGSYQPDFRLGLLNSITFKNFNLSFLIDGQVGGTIYSRSHALYGTSGAIVNDDDPNLALTSLEGRTSYGVDYDSAGNPAYTIDQQGSVIGPGVMFNASDQLVPNTVAVPAGGAGYTGYFYNYYGHGFNRDNIEAATYDATYFKLRELSVSYIVDQVFIDKLGLQSAVISLVGRNLLLISDVPTIDPETYSIRNGLFVNGYESTSLPSTRSFGLNLNLKF